MSDRPNLVLFMPDQLRADAVGCFGSTVAQTPVIDALAARGARFDHAYVQHSVCSPSRASIFTGWYPHVAGHRSLTHLLKPWEPNLLRSLKVAGYTVAWVGQRGDTFAPGVVAESTDFHGFLVEPAVFLEASPHPPDSPWQGAFYHGRRQAPPGEVVLDFDEATVRTAEAWLASSPPEPWVLLVALVFPHPPFAVEDPWFSMHDRRDMPPPARWVPDGKPRYMHELRRRSGTGQLGADAWAEIAAVYHGMTSRVDWQLGRVLEAVDLAGASERTVTFFFPDHGEYLGDHGLVEKWPSGQHDSLLRNPLVVAGPGVAEGVVVDPMVELVDLLPTCIELAGTEARHTHFGRSLVPLLAGKVEDHRDLAFSEGGFLVAEEHLLERSPAPYATKSAIQHEDPVTVGRVVSVRDQRWTYVHRLYEGPELYDRRTDPHETVNVAGRPGSADVELRLRDEVLRWLLETADVLPWDTDPRFEPEFTELVTRQVKARRAAARGGEP